MFGWVLYVSEQISQTTALLILKKKWVKFEAEAMYMDDLLGGVARTPANI